MRVLIIDHQDSFAFNLYQAIGALGHQPLVVRSRALELSALIALGAERVVLSPGPGSPADPAYAGDSLALIAALGGRTPILGVCFGHQAIIQALGGAIVRALRPMHGKTSPILHQGHPLFEGLPSPFTAMRYHSLVGDPAQLPSALSVIAREPSGEIMAVAHQQHPIFGVQFHPESIGTPLGPRLLANFLSSALTP